MMHQEMVGQEWREEFLSPFDELMISWNAARPLQGGYLFYVRVKIDEWSPWLLYASWGSDGQSSFFNEVEGVPVRVYQDAVEILEGKKATGFQIKVVADGAATADRIYRLHVYMNSDKTEEPQQTMMDLSSICLQVEGLSQKALQHTRSKDLCSPSATTAVIRYLSRNREIDPIYFAQNVWDREFDIFGNWVLNVAQAAVELGRRWNCWVERLSSFHDIYRYLQQDTPVIVSVRGPLEGSHGPYSAGHLMAVIGYDSSRNQVICMDPAFPSDLQTRVFYDLSGFIQAWNRRGRISYIFSVLSVCPVVFYR